jgi:REP element-mobilizing transposase RayT
LTTGTVDVIGEIKMGRQVEMAFRTWGGKRKGAGRPPKGARAGAPHKRRPALKATTPVHVTLRVLEAVGRLRRLDTWRALRWAAARILERQDFRIIHISIQGNHVHLIVEAEHEVALARGMQAFEISAARAINLAISKRTGRRRRGQVFADRYHPEQLTSPRQCRNALSYVLNNWRKHREDTARTGAPLDKFATGWHWDGWSEPIPGVRLTPTTELVPVSFPTTWLLKKGWRAHGLVSPWEIPGAGR